MSQFFTTMKRLFAVCFSVWLLSAWGNQPRMQADVRAGEPPRAEAAGQPGQKPLLTPAKDISPLFEDLRSPYADVRERAMFALAKAGKAVTKPARDGLGDKDPRYRAACIDLLALAGDVNSLPELVELAAGDKGPALIRLNALRAVDVLDPSREKVEGMLRGGRARAAGAVLRALRDLDPKDPANIAWKEDLLVYRNPRRPMSNLAITGVGQQDESLDDLLNKINGLLSQGETAKALSAAQAALNSAPDSLMPDNRNEHLCVNAALVYSRAVRPFILSNLKQYREMFDDQARRQLQSLRQRGGGPQLLREFLYRYRYTAYGATALRMLLEEKYERERYDEVIMEWNAFRDIHDKADTASLIITAISYCRLGRLEDARTMLIDIASRPDGAKVRAGGVEMKTSDFLMAEIRKALAADSRTAAANSAEEFPQRTTGVKLGGLDFGSVAWSRHAGVLYAGARVEYYTDAKGTEIKLMPWEMPSDPEKKRKFLKARNLTYQSGATPGIRYGGAPPVDPHPYRPVVCGNRVVINNGNSVYCLRLSDGKLLWKYDNGVNAVMQGSRQNLGIHRDTKFPHATVVPEKRAVYVIIEDSRSYRKKMATLTKYSKTRKRGKKHPERIPVNAVVCLDLDTGKVRWSTADGDDDSRRAWFRSGPRYAGDVVLLTVSTGFSIIQKKDFVDISMLALDADTGRVRWRLPLSAWSGWGKIILHDPEAEGGTVRQCPAVLPPTATTIGRSAVVLTNAGTLVCVDIDSGRRRWIAQYPEFTKILAIASHYRMQARNQGRFPKHEINLPPVVCRDRIYIMPFDSDYFMAYDTSGRMLWRVRAALLLVDERRGSAEIRRNSEQFCVDTQGTVYLVGKDVRAYSPDGVLLWRNTDVSAAGSAVLGEDYLAVPTTGKTPQSGAVVLLDLKTGRTAKRHELDLPKLLLPRFKALASQALSNDKDKAIDAFDELVRFGAPAVAALRKIAGARESETAKKHLDYLINRVERMDKGLSWRELHGNRHRWGANLALVKGRLLLTTREGVILAFKTATN
ncbi:MAG: hypothetical protein DRP79_06855 [Planctomycetota bacterium]|nr:MAG: hypothetical protein DRP79_06855 [Planctomycetota bacterium]